MTSWPLSYIQGETLIDHAKFHICTLSAVSLEELNQKYTDKVVLYSIYLIRWNQGLSRGKGPNQDHLSGIKSSNSRPLPTQ